MKVLIDMIEKFVQENKEDILQYFGKCHSYFIDLIISKGVEVNSNIEKNANEPTKSIIFSMINTTNSGLHTIGISPEILKLPNDIYEFVYNNDLKNYNTYLDFFNLYLKSYINNYLLIVLIEFIANIDKKKLENLDLFDLIPQGFLKKLKNYKDNNYKFMQGSMDDIKAFINQISEYFDPLNLIFKNKDIKIGAKKENLTEIDILRRLQSAKKENLGVLKIQGNLPLNNENRLKIYNTKQFEIYEQKPFFLLEHFQNFPKISYEIVNKFHINFENLNKAIKNKYEDFDLEEIFYIVSIFKILNQQLPINTNLIEYTTREFINGTIFSTGKYHIPNPISIFYGLTIFSQLGIVNKSDLIDISDIEMNLEKELINFNPKNSYLNFHILMGLKLLQGSGGPIKHKESLLNQLLKFDIEKVEKFAPDRDLFYHIASIKLIDPNFDMNSQNKKYYNILSNYFQSNASINSCLTNIARALLTFRTLDLGITENGLLKRQYNYVMEHLDFFNANINNKFSWKFNKLAIKIELRMLFWSLLLFI